MENNNNNNNNCDNGNISLGVAATRDATMEFSIFTSLKTRARACTCHNVGLARARASEQDVWRPPARAHNEEYKDKWRFIHRDKILCHVWRVGSLHRWSVCLCVCVCAILQWQQTRVISAPETKCCSLILRALRRAGASQMKSQHKLRVRARKPPNRPRRRPEEVNLGGRVRARARVS